MLCFDGTKELQYSILIYFKLCFDGSIIHVGRLLFPFSNFGVIWAALNQTHFCHIN